MTSRTTKGLSSKEEIAPASPRFPDICMICKKKTLKVNQKAQPLTKVLTKTAEKTIKEAATLNNDTEILLQIMGMDLIAREFQKHEKCYREYTRHKKTEQLEEKLDSLGPVHEFVCISFRTGNRNCFKVK